MYFSLIIPVYNRPFEIGELLDSLSASTYAKTFEVVVVEDGSTEKSEAVVDLFREKLQISYFFKPNSGPGDSRNFGMRQAKGDYFLIFDSDCIIPPQYLDEVEKALAVNPVDCFGGPDAALGSFTDIQKAINFAMTSFLTTGGIRGGSERLGKFQPRSFNMGMSRAAFDSSGGFGHIHPGEDPDLSIRLWDLGFKTALFPKAYVFHKRRINWSKFYTQVNKFGKARPILDSWHPKHTKPTFYMPTGVLLVALAAAILAAFGYPLLLFNVLGYFVAVLMLASAQYRSFKIGWFAVAAVAIQFYGYGTGFLKSFVKVRLLKQNPEKAFPELFFKK
ncbi:glycosyltransferase [Flavobacterium caeni]|uniref:Glycosyltransferase, catalytic subunit of cellulose synthase and poly-beta-1,6-N-acetylglucosamine synthase n=1 Tax=Flavobacterium caeni TaxID=490189 RepID=A0A1G5BG10_9FLAO|nr:glycosyltransferase [Flavobacterium caeni]SCX89061.1 Glycosyltransferase, catalytic subunit of cellulose synthase and poly-beta-1,6-N-acetylglucosamine synthase [Flavobacterium caeni]